MLTFNYMTEREIMSSYNSAKNRTEQVKILAQLNDCTIEDMKGFLKSQGVDARQLPRSKRSKKPTECTSKQKSINEKDIVSYIQELKSKRAELQKEIEEINSTLCTIQRECEVL